MLRIFYAAPKLFIAIFNSTETSDILLTTNDIGSVPSSTYSNANIVLMKKNE